MEITVSARHAEVPESLRRATMEKIGRLARFVEELERAEVHFSRLGNTRIPEREVCEVVLEDHGHHVRCKVTAADTTAAVNKAAVKLEQQLHKLKTRLSRRNRAAGRARAGAVDDVAVAALPDEADPDGGPRIVKTKRHTLQPMSPEEAAVRLDLLGHDFYFFHNADTGRAAVVYRRADGDLGLIDEAG